MKVTSYIIVSLSLSAILFYLSYQVFDEVAAASTGYNAKDRGWFGWEYRFVEHSFEIRDDQNNPTIIDSGTKIIPDKLISEIMLWSSIGFGTTGVIAFARSQTKEKNVAEQVVALNR